jgi:LmbE family N-acetylglucosaminyl deacetylase
MAFPGLARSGLAPHAVRRLYLFWSERSNAWVDVTSTLERKLSALAEHRSQIHDHVALAERIRAWAKEEGAAIGVDAAEALRVVVIDDDEDEGPSVAADGASD